MGGRGRGRGAFLEETLDIAPRRPGRGIPTLPTPSEDHVLAQLFRGPITEMDGFTFFHEYFQNVKIDEVEEKSYRCIDFIGQNVMQDSSNAHLIAKNIFVMGTNPKVGSQLKKKAFSKLEDLYLGLSDIKAKQGKAAYRNVVNFIVSMAHFCRPITITPFDSIVSGILSIAESLAATSEEEDMKLLAVIIIRSSSYLMMKDPGGKAVRSYLTSNLHPLTNKVRRKLCTETLSKKSRTWLLLSIELMYSTFEDLNEETQRFYMDELGKLSAVMFQKVTEQIFIRSSEATKYLTSEIKNEISLF